MMTPPITRPLQVLILDDDPRLLRALQRMLDATRFAVTITDQVEAAQDLVQTQHFDIVLADYQLHAACDGITFLASLKELAPQCLRVLITAYADTQAMVRAVNEAQVAHLLHKPINATHLNALMDNLAQHIRLSHRNRELEAQVLNHNRTLQRLNQDLQDQVQARTLALLNGLLSALELRDTETQFHCRRVALYTRAMAVRMGIAGDALDDIQRGALLHDIGKIGIPDAIMLKPGPLNDAEWEIMRNHPSIGHRLIGSIDFLAGANHIVCEHHERFDGKGYPHGLEGEAIHLGARLFAIADAVDAMTSDRPYRKALSFEVASEEVQRMAGVQFDPQAVEVFRSIPAVDWRVAIAMGHQQEQQRPMDEDGLRDWHQSVFAKVIDTMPSHALALEALLVAPSQPFRT